MRMRLEGLLLPAMLGPLAASLGCGGDDAADGADVTGPDDTTTSTNGTTQGSADTTSASTSSADTTSVTSDTGTESGSETGGNPGTCNATLVFSNDFNDDAVGTYADIDDWNANWDSGIDEGRVEIIEGADAYEGRSLRVHYPEGGVGPGEGGAQWMVPLGDSYDELYLAYRVRFAPGFDFVLGGKLPGLVGGTAPTGCVDDPDGFSARGMWRTDGAAVQYMYFPEKVNNCGDDYDYENGAGAITFEPGTWHTVEHHLTMNTPGAYDGTLQAWFDGELVLDEQTFLYRLDGGGFSVDAIYFSTFFGGSSPEWGPTQDETIDYDDFIICTGPITH